MLPYETAAVRLLWAKIKDDANAAERLHDAIVAAFVAEDLNIENGRGLTHGVVQLVMGLLTKGCKTFRAVELTAVNGLGEDAGTLTRSLYETTMAVLFILQKDSRRRAVMFHAYAAEQKVKMVRNWQRTPGLKRHATKELLMAVEAWRDQWRVKLPRGVNVSQHWSGSPQGLRGAATMLRADRSYEGVYRLLSAHSHGTDLESHMAYDESGGAELKLFPGEAYVRSNLTLSRGYLWTMADRINTRAGFSLDATLAAVRPPELGAARRARNGPVAKSKGRP